LTEFEYIAQYSDHGKRADQVLGQHLPEYSRSQIQKWVKDGQLRINQQSCLKPNKPLKENDQITLIIPPATPLIHAPQNIALDIIHEDHHILLINKPANLTVHPGAGNPQDTLLNGLLMHDPKLIELPRAGIVHRLDKDTSGLMVIAKTIEAQNALIEMIKRREVTRIYLALTWGQTPLQFSVDAPIGRHKTKRTLMTVTASGKPAKTHFETIEKLGNFSLLSCKLETGRTHQIRVHLLHEGYPIIGDSTYQKKIPLAYPVPWTTQQAINSLNRQFLHAHKLSFLHPLSHKSMQFECPLPLDLVSTLNQLRS